MTITQLINRIRPSGAAARARYFELDSDLYALGCALGEAHDPADRAALLWSMAERGREQADVHQVAFGPDPIEWENGRDLAESLAHSADLYRLLASVEQQLATGRVGTPDGSPLRGTDVDVQLLRAAAPVLGQMVNTPDLTARTALLQELYEAVEPIIGGQAAETLACLPSPGHDGWRTHDQNAAWRKEIGADNRGIRFLLFAARYWTRRAARRGRQLLGRTA